MVGRTRSYFWFDTPDGEDILKKTNYAMKLGAMAGLGIGVIDANLVAKTQCLRTLGFRYATWVVPATGGAAMFAITSQLLCKHVPQLDPRASYAIAGALTGSVVGAATKSIYLGTLAGFYFGIIACIGRELQTYPSDLFPTTTGQFPRVIVNDDPLWATDFRGAPLMSLPPPAARPAIAPSTLYSFY